ncbi:hypothetical protein QFZ43_004110 [Streptomyces afghaniensis]|nr:hypothetical protein [Streptomyces afghaniensis]
MAAVASPTSIIPEPSRRSEGAAQLWARGRKWAPTRAQTRSTVHRAKRRWTVGQAGPNTGGNCRQVHPETATKMIAVRHSRSPARRLPPPCGGRLRKESDLAVRDFYTFQNTHGEPDGRTERVLQKFEGSAASASRRVTSSVTWGRPITPEDRTDLSVFTTFRPQRPPVRLARRHAGTA